MRTVGFTFHIRGRRDERVSIEDAYLVGETSLLYLETIFTFLSLLDPQRMAQMDNDSLCAAFDDLGEIGRSFTSEALSRLDQLEEARKALIAITPEQGGKE